MNEHIQYGTLDFTDDQIIHAITNIKLEIENTDPLVYNDLVKDETVIFIIDMINGFAKEGELSSNRVNALIPRIVKLMETARGVRKVFICDSHPLNAVEFFSYPIHALDGSDESEIVKELKPFIDERSQVIKKNSTNAMMTTDLIAYLENHSEINNFILVGDCTDICILQCALSLKSYFNQNNLEKNVIVPYNLVETYDLELTNHTASLMNLMALYNMKINGVQIYSSIEY